MTDEPGGSEEWKARGVALRAFFYIAATHFLAGFLWLLFHVGTQGQK
ncbi:DUF6126 family protein [Streptomyces sp. NPDC048172]